MEWAATGAFHNPDELYDAKVPSTHPHDHFMLWLFGPAGAGKSAISKRIGELAAEKGLLIARPETRKIVLSQR